MSVTLIVEPNAAGHRFQAAADVATVALSDGAIMLLTSTGAASGEEFKSYMSHLPVTVLDPLSSASPSTQDLIRCITDACREHVVSRVVLMEADNALKSWWHAAFSSLHGLEPRPRIDFFLTRWPRLEWRGNDPYFLRIRAAKMVLVLLARLTRTLDRCSGFATRDTRSRGWLVKNVRDTATCSAHSRDRKRLRDELSLPPDRRLVGIFGGIDVRKNPPVALDAVLAAGPDCDLLLAGPVDDQTHAWLAALPPDARHRVLVRDGFHSNAELDRMLAASDVVLLLMTLEGPSGIMGKAMVADVPVVTAGSRARAREMSTLHRGVATNPEAADLAAGLRRVLDDVLPGTGTAVDLPTAETFGRTILGFAPTDPALRSPLSVLGSDLVKAARAALG
jgi:glycosyltransferase involved in cell wall biosynthesis